MKSELTTPKPGVARQSNRPRAHLEARTPTAQSTTATVLRSSAKRSGGGSLTFAPNTEVAKAILCAEYLTRLLSKRYRQNLSAECRRLLVSFADEFSSPTDPLGTTDERRDLAHLEAVQIALMLATIDPNHKTSPFRSPFLSKVYGGRQALKKKTPLSALAQDIWAQPFTLQLGAILIGDGPVEANPLLLDSSSCSDVDSEAVA